MHNKCHVVLLIPEIARHYKQMTFMRWWWVCMSFENTAMQCMMRLDAKFHWHL